MDIWERQRDLIELKLVRVRGDIAEVEDIRATSVIQDSPNLVQRVDALIVHMRRLQVFYEQQRAEAERRIAKEA